MKIRSSLKEREKDKFYRLERLDKYNCNMPIWDSIRNEVIDRIDFEWKDRNVWDIRDSIFIVTARYMFLKLF